MTSFDGLDENAFNLSNLTPAMYFGRDSSLVLVYGFPFVKIWRVGRAVVNH